MKFFTSSKDKREIEAARRPGGIVVVSDPRYSSKITGCSWYEESAPVNEQAWSAITTNCKNCGAPYEPVKCSYCGTHHAQ